MKSRTVRWIFTALCLVLPCLIYWYYTGDNFAGAASDYLIMGGMIVVWLAFIAALIYLLAHREGGKPVWNKKSTVRLVICAMMVALGVVLGGMLSIPAVAFGSYSVKIGFGTLPVILTGIIFGPGYGAMVGGLVDLIQALVFPKGPYIPFFTVIGVLFGFIPGLFFTKKQKPVFLRILAAVAAGQTVASVICNTLLLIWLYNMPWATFIPRIINQAVMIPVYSVLVYGIIRLLKDRKILPSEL